LPNLGNQLQWQIEYEPDAVIARVLLAGDYDRDDAVDAADYAVWRKPLGTNVTSLGDGADGNHNGAIDEDDFSVWRTHFGQNAVSTRGTADNSTPAPEPTGIALLIASFLFCGRRSRA
jgi:hypothetical protein